MAQSKVKAPRPARLSHLDARGAARMVDVGGKPATAREATAEAEVRLGQAAWKALVEGSAPKGDVFAVVRLAGIQAAKRTPDLIPLCHPLSLHKVEVRLDLDPARRIAKIHASVRCEGKTGVEMEAMTAVSVAALALYDMLKGIEKGIEIGPIRLLEKKGGKSGIWKRKP